MDTVIRFFTRSLLLSLVTAGFPLSVQAAIVDLRTAGSSGVINGAIYEQITPHSTGTGLIDSFVQQSPQGNGTTSHAFNTTVNNILDNKSSDNFNHSILLSDVHVVMRGGLPYRRFLLDINESNGNDDEFISLDEVVIFVGGTSNSNVTTFAGGILQHNGAIVYRMDAGGDSWAALDASLNSGSGSGDMLLLVPQTAFAGHLGSSVVTLYSAFGGQGIDPVDFVGNFGASGGFEEWATAIPEPTTWLLVATALAAMVTIRRLGNA
jgi:hypothetical protein